MSRFSSVEQVPEVCTSIRLWEWMHSQTSWWEVATQMCLSCYLIFASHADLSQSVPEVGSALAHNKPVNTAAAASPDVLPWPLCSSTVYSPSGIYREKTMWRELRILMVMKYQKCKLGTILPAGIFATDEVISTRQDKDLFSDVNTSSSWKHWPLGNS